MNYCFALNSKDLYKSSVENIEINICVYQKKMAKELKKKFVVLSCVYDLEDHHYLWQSD